MKTSKLLFFSLLLMMLFACKKQTEVEPSLAFVVGVQNPAIEMASNGDLIVTLPSYEGSCSVGVSSMASWNLTYENASATEWCVVSPLSGEAGESTIQIKVLDNSLGSERTAKLKVSNGAVSKVISIVQKAPERLSFGAGAVLKENVRILDAQFSQYVLRYSDNQVVVSATIPSDLKPSVGSILVFPLPLAYRPAYIGKVTNIEAKGNEIILAIEHPRMEEVFSSLNQEFELNSSNIRVGVDPNSEGEDADVRVVDNSVWNDIDVHVISDDNNAAPSRVTAGYWSTSEEKENVDFTIEFTVKKDYFSGQIYVRTHGNVSMSSLTDADMSLHQEIGLKGDFYCKDISTERTRIPLLNAKKICVYGNLLAGLMFKPEVDFFYEGNLNISSGLNFQFVNFDFNSVVRNYQVTASSVRNNGAKTYFKMFRIDLSGECGFSTLGRLYFMLGDEDLLSFGAQLEAGVGLLGDVNFTIQTQTEKLFDSQISVYPFLTAMPYVQFDGEVYEYDNLKVQYKGNPYFVSLLPAYVFNNAKKKSGKVSVNANVKKECFISAKEDGVALFKKGGSTPVMYSTPSVAANVMARRAPAENQSYDFSVEDDAEYEVAPYVELKDGKKVFGHRTEVEGDAVNLGLPSGTKWAGCNVGANTPEEYGNYYAWGETKTKSDYSWTTYKWCNGAAKTLTKYCTISSYGTADSKKVLESADDVAAIDLGDKWRMPTAEEWTELLTECTWTWITQNDVYGFRVSAQNGNSIFLPAAGYYNGTELYNIGMCGAYWSSSVKTSSPSNAHFLDFAQQGKGLSESARSYGYSVRPVCK